MGPDPVMGLFALLGVVMAAIAVAGLLNASTRLYAFVFAVPGIGLALMSVPGQVGFMRITGLCLMFFAVGSLVVGLPLAGLQWFWQRHRVTKPGTLQ